MELDLDIKTLSIVTVLICVTYGFGILMLQSIQKNVHGLVTLAAAVFAIAIGFFTLSFGNSTSLWLSKVFANSTICLGFTLIVYSLQRFRFRSSARLTYCLFLSASTGCLTGLLFSDNRFHQCTDHRGKSVYRALLLTLRLRRPARKCSRQPLSHWAATRGLCDVGTLDAVSNLCDLHELTDRGFYVCQ